MPENSYQFFSNTRCKYFPCHKGLCAESFNCLFCYCPLYALGRDCGGNFMILENGVKSCEACLLPHKPGGYAYILSRLPELIDQVKKQED